MKVPTSIILVALMSGCSLLPRVKQQGGDKPLAATATSVASAVSSTNEVEQARAKQLSKVAAAIREGKTQNEDNVDGPAKVATRHQLEVADKVLGVEPSIEDQLETAQLSLADREGRLADSKKLLDSATKQATDLKTQLDKASRDRDVALQNATRQVATAQQQIRTSTAENQRKLDELQKKLDDTQKSTTMKWLFGLGSLCVLAGAGILVVTKLTELTRGLIAIGIGLLCFGAARMIGHWLFPYVAWGIVGVTALTGIGVLVYERRQHRLKQDMEVLKETASHVVEAVETGKKQDGTSVVDLSSLSRAMDKIHKETISSLVSSIRKQ